MSRPNLPKSTPAELDEFLVRMIRDGHAVFDPVIEKYKLTKTGEQFVDYYTGKPPSKERIRKVMEQLVRKGHATYDPATGRYALTELGRQHADDDDDDDYYYYDEL
jgi:RecB family exonuclease